VRGAVKREADGNDRGAMLYGRKVKPQGCCLRRCNLEAS
jgi:hypothetical protein